MIKRVIQSVLCVFTALMLLIGNTSKEYLHLFADHQDTVHCHDDFDGLVFDNEHHHCDFLSFTLPPFVDDAFTFQLTTPHEYGTVFPSEEVTHLIPRVVYTSPLRGPPAV